MNNRKPKTTTQRGYGHRHQQLRKRWRTLLVREGQLPCTRCQEPVTPDQAWELDHSDDRTTYLGIAHESCNRSAGGKKAQRGRIKRWEW